jgi:hypothetical protein
MLLIFPVGVVGSKQQNEAQPRTTTEEFMVQPPWIPFPTTMSFPRHEAEWIAAAFRRNASGVSDADRFWQLHHTSCRLIVHRSCPEDMLILPSPSPSSPPPEQTFAMDAR